MPSSSAASLIQAPLASPAMLSPETVLPTVLYPVTVPVYETGLLFFLFKFFFLLLLLKLFLLQFLLLFLLFPLLIFLNAEL